MSEMGYAESLVMSLIEEANDIIWARGEREDDAALEIAEMASGLIPKILGIAQAASSAF